MQNCPVPIGDKIKLVYPPTPLTPELIDPQTKNKTYALEMHNLKTVTELKVACLFENVTVAIRIFCIIHFCIIFCIIITEVERSFSKLNQMKNI